MTCERTILLVVHTGRDEATEVARRVEKVLGDNGIGLRVLSSEAVDRGPVHLAPDDMRALGVEIEVVDADERAAEVRVDRLDRAQSLEARGAIEPYDARHHSCLTSGQCVRTS